MSAPPSPPDSGSKPDVQLTLDEAFTVERWVAPFRSPNAHIPPRPRKAAPPLGVTTGPPPVMPLEQRTSRAAFFRVERDVPLLPAPSLPGRSTASPWGLVILAALICLDLIGAALLHYRRHLTFAKINDPRVTCNASIRDRPGQRGNIGTNETCKPGASHPSSSH